MPKDDPRSEARATIPGSEYPQTAGAEVIPLAADRQLTVSIILKPQPMLEDAVARVQSFAQEYGLQVVEADAAKRTVKVSGTVAQLDAAFGIEVGQYGDHIGYRGPISVPASIGNDVIAVLGLDTRAAAKPRVSAGPHQ